MNRAVRTYCTYVLSGTQCKDDHRVQIIIYDTVCTKYEGLRSTYFVFMLSAGVGLFTWNTAKKLLYFLG